MSKDLLEKISDIDKELANKFKGIITFFFVFFVFSKTREELLFEELHRQMFHLEV